MKVYLTFLTLTFSKKSWFIHGLILKCEPKSEEHLTADSSMNGGNYQGGVPTTSCVTFIHLLRREIISYPTSVVFSQRNPVFYE